MSRQLLLYTTSYCHLCDLAVGYLDELALSNCLELVEIAENDTLIQLYGTRIPVLQRKDNASELAWPFTKADILAWIAD